MHASHWPGVVVLLLGLTISASPSQDPDADPCDESVARFAEEGETGYAPRRPGEGGGDPCCEGTFAVEVSDRILRVSPVGCSVYFKTLEAEETVASLAWERRQQPVRIRASSVLERSQYQMDALGRPHPSAAGARIVDVFRWNTSILRRSGLELTQVVILAWSRESYGNGIRHVLHPLAVNGPAGGPATAEQRRGMAANARIKLTLRSSAPLRDREVVGDWIRRDADGLEVEKVPATVDMGRGQNLIEVELRTAADGSLWTLEYEVVHGDRDPGRVGSPQEVVHVRAPSRAFMEWALGLEQE